MIFVAVEEDEGRKQIPLWGLLLVIVISPVLLAAIIPVAVGWAIAYIFLHCSAWCWWNARGVDVLFVYSNSPVWQKHIETEVLPVIRSRAVVLNWSKRRTWRFGLASIAFHFFGGRREYNPIAVVFRPLRRTQVFRFWRPFRDWKHGKTDLLQQVETDFFASIGMRQ